MYWEKRKNKNGIIYYSFAYYDKRLKKTIRLKKSQVPSNINSEQGAEEFCKIKEAEYESVKIRIQRKLEWKKKFYNFNELFDLFQKDMKKKAPNTWKNSCYFIEQYVFPFFLTEIQCNNINNWNLFYQDFIEWLSNVKPTKGNKENISYSTQNHVISALNNFIVIMKKHNKIEKIDKCSKYQTHLLPSRDIEDVFTEEEIYEVNAKITNCDLFDLFNVLLRTGLRISECLALSVEDFFTGEPEHDTLKRSFKNHNIQCFGYLVIESQLGDKIKVRNENGRVIRKPLKGRKRIKTGEGRIVPIYDKDIFNILAKRFNTQLERLRAQEFGADGKDYLLFEGVHRNALNVALSEVYEKFNGKYKRKSQHCCRHTFSTNFVGLTCGDFFLAKAILGHKDVDTTMRYVHIFEAINRKAKKKEMKLAGIELL